MLNIKNKGKDTYSLSFFLKFSVTDWLEVQLWINGKIFKQGSESVKCSFSLEQRRWWNVLQILKMPARVLQIQITTNKCFLSSPSFNTSIPLLSRPKSSILKNKVSKTEIGALFRLMPIKLKFI